MKVKNKFSNKEYEYEFRTWNDRISNKDCYDVLDWGDLVMAQKIQKDNSRIDWQIFDRHHIAKMIDSNPHDYAFRTLLESDWLKLRQSVIASSEQSMFNKGGLDFSPKEGGFIQKGNDYLLAIGIDDYTEFFPLKNAVKDVEDFAALLTSSYGFRADAPFIKLLLNAKATRRNIIHCFEELCDLEPNDRVIIYYSGHGYLNNKTRHGFWIPVDAVRDDVSTYLTNSIIRDYVKSINCRHILLISDSCFSRDLLVRGVTRGSDNAFREWENLRSRWVFCSGKDVVSDGIAGENSPFAAQILRCLEELSEEPLNIARLADEVTRRVSFNYEQLAEANPLHGVGHEGGQFIFYPQKDAFKNLKSRPVAQKEIQEVGKIKPEPFFQAPIVSIGEVQVKRTGNAAFSYNTIKHIDFRITFTVCNTSNVMTSDFSLELYLPLAFYKSIEYYNNSHRIKDGISSNREENGYAVIHCEGKKVYPKQTVDICVFTFQLRRDTYILLDKKPVIVKLYTTNDCEEKVINLNELFYYKPPSNMNESKLTINSFGDSF